MIDWDRVKELRDEIGADGFCEVVDLFLEEVDLVVDRLDKHPDPARYEQDLHFLKGSAWNLGFADFGRLCMEGERLAGGLQGHRIDIRQILDCYRTSRGAFLSAAESMCAGRSSSAA